MELKLKLTDHRVRVDARENESTVHSCEAKATGVIDYYYYIPTATIDWVVNMKLTPYTIPFMPQCRKTGPLRGFAESAYSCATLSVLNERTTIANTSGTSHGLFKLRPLRSQGNVNILCTIGITFKHCTTHKCYIHLVCVLVYSPI